MYFVFIFTNRTKTVFNIGITENLERTFNEFNSDSTHTQPYANYKIKSIYLIYFKSYQSKFEAENAECFLKKTSRLKQEREIRTMNPEFRFLNI